MKYVDKLKDPRWQKKRLEIFQRDSFKCIWCEDTTKTLHVHHLRYEHNKNPWDYKNEYLVTVCEYCHEMETLYRKETERELLEALALKQFSQFDLSLLLGYIVDSPEKLKDLTASHDFEIFKESLDNAIL